MTKEFLNELEDSFVDQEKSLHRFVFELITGLCRDAKLCKLSKSTPVNRLINNQRKQGIVRFRDIKLSDYSLPTNPEWLPKDTTPEDMTYFELNLREKTMEYLNLFGQIISIRVQEFNVSATRHEESILDELIYNNKSKEIIANQAKQNKENITLREEQTPKCLEEAIYSQIFPAIHNEVSKNVDLEFNNEFEEEYGNDEKERSLKIKKRVTKR